MKSWQPWLVGPSVRAWWLGSITLLAAACRDDAGVAPPQPRVVSSVARVVVAAPRQVLEPGDSVRYTAQAFDAQGLVIPTATIVWSSNKPSVATVDARGTVVARAEGTAQIVATAEGQSGSVDLEVSITQLCDCTRVVDSTAMQLVQRNDSSGVFVFRVVSPRAPAIDSGSIIVGAEDGGFLRRVTRVERAGNVITLQTTQAYLEEAVREGAFASTSFSEGESVPLDEGAARWGPWAIAEIAPNVQLAGAKCCSLDDIAVSLELGGDVKVKGEFTIKKGNISFEPRLEIGGDFSNFRVQRFRTALRGGIGLNIDEYELTVGIEGSKDSKIWTSVPKKKRRLARLVKPFTFFIGPVPVVGIINKEIALEVSVEVGANAVFAGKYRKGFEVTAGAEWLRSSGWRAIHGSSSYLDATAPEFKGVEGSAAVKVALVPEYSILFYGVGGPFVNLEPYAELEGTTTLSFEDGAPSGLDHELKVSVGLNVNIGAKLSVFGFVDLAEAGFEIPIIRPYTLARAFSDGPLTARTTVTGPDQPEAIAIRLRPTFEDRYEMGPLGLVASNGPPPFGRDLATSTQDGSVAPNDSVTFQDVRSGDDFMHRVALHDLAGNCSATDSTAYGVGVRSKSFLFLSKDAPSSVDFTIECIPMGAMRVRTIATGQDVVTRSRLVLARRDTIGAGKGTPPVSLSLPAGPAPPDSVIDDPSPANPALGTLGLHDATLDPGRRNCAVAKPTTHRAAIASGDTAVTEFRLTCVALGSILMRTQTSDPDEGAPSDPVQYRPRVTANDAADQVTTQPALIGATDSVVMRGLVPVYNASGASGRHTVQLQNLPNRCVSVGPLTRNVTVFTADTAITPFMLQCVERLHVRTTSGGLGTDRDGYIVVIENADGSADSAAIGVNATIGIAHVRPGAHVIRLADVDPNCNAPASVNRTVSGRDSTLVSFAVNCPGPPAPTGLRATQILSDRVDLAWDPPPPGRRVAHYRLYRVTGTPTSTTPIDSIVGLAHGDAGLTSFSRYAYQVAAVDTDGVAGPRSAVLSVRTLDGTPPTAPTNLTAVAASASRINLSWTAASDAESGVSRYRVYRGGVLIDSTSATSFGDGGLSGNTSYSYHVVAVNGGSLTGSQSNTASATTLDGTPPTAPANLSATAVSTTQIDLAWDAASDAESGVSAYRIYRAGVLIGSAASTSFSDGGLTPNTTYTYEVAAVNGAGLEGPRTAPAAATTKAPNVTGDLVVNASSTGSGIPAAGYQVEVSGTGVLLTQPIGPNGSVTFAGLTAQTYTVTFQNLPANCAVDDGLNPRSIVVVGGSTVSTSFRVRCN